ncbi:lysozyme family protein [Merdibacter massiliensis]|uniref:lysozyme family protein n=1 Tax=Merdibacter massiliensis TaxID=1871030 RepID=UPI00096A2A6B|nr:lysozyme family protein [Merdibacter massiliensis]
MKWIRRSLLIFFLFPLLALFSILLVSGGGVSNAQSNDSIDRVSTLNVQVENYRMTVKEIAADNGMEEYVDLILAVMQIESGGNGNDPMQASEGPFNFRYPHLPNAILDPIYSIECGIKELKSCLELANVKNPQDLEAIKIALQGYNFGNGYISWIQKNGGKWSLESSNEFAKLQCELLGWSSYGDPHYAAKVMSYYTYSLIVVAEGDFIIPMRDAVVTSDYGGRDLDTFHYGLDLSAGYGATIYAPIDAIVHKASSSCESNGGYYGNYCPFDQAAGAGNYIQLEIHYDERVLYMTLAHMENIYVNEGQQVVQGQAIGTQGNSGNSTGSHLHIEIHEDTAGSLGTSNKIIDPTKLFKELG